MATGGGNGRSADALNIFFLRPKEAIELYDLEKKTNIFCKRQIVDSLRMPRFRDTIWLELHFSKDKKFTAQLLSSTCSIQRTNLSTAADTLFFRWEKVEIFAKA
jgi:hypothetical protein